MELIFSFSNKPVRRNRIRVHSDGTAYVSSPRLKALNARKVIDATGIPVDRVYITISPEPPLVHNGKKRRK